MGSLVNTSYRAACAILLRCWTSPQGRDSGAWCYTPRLDGSYSEGARRLPGKLRIALSLDPKFPPTTLEPEVSDAIRKTAALCEELGHDVEEADLEFDHEAMLRSFALIWSVSLRGGVEAISAMTGRAIGPDTLEPHVLAAWRDTENVSGVELNAALSQMNMVSRAYGKLFERYDVVLTPAGRMEPFEIGRIGAIAADSFFDWFMGMCAHCPFLSTVNIAGIPAISLPLGWSPGDCLSARISLRQWARNSACCNSQPNWSKRVRGQD